MNLQVAAGNYARSVAAAELLAHAGTALGNVLP